MSTTTQERIPELTLGWRLKMALGDMPAHEMAEQLDMSRAQLSRWMADKGAPPKRPYLAQWALLTGVDFQWLVTGQASSQQPDPGGSEAEHEALRRLTDAKRNRRSARHAGDRRTRGYHELPVAA